MSDPASNFLFDEELIGEEVQILSEEGIFTVVGVLAEEGRFLFLLSDDRKGTFQIADARSCKLTTYGEEDYTQ